MVMVVQTLRRPDNVKMDRVMVAIAAIGSENWTDWLDSMPPPSMKI